MGGHFVVDVESELVEEVAAARSRADALERAVGHPPPPSHQVLPAPLLHAYASALTAGRVAQLEALLASADAEIRAQIAARLEVEVQLRTSVEELRATLSVSSERARRLRAAEDEAARAAHESSTLAERLAAVRARKDELERQVTAAAAVASGTEAAKGARGRLSVGPPGSRHHPRRPRPSPSPSPPPPPSAAASSAAVPSPSPSPHLPLLEHARTQAASLHRLLLDAQARLHAARVLQDRVAALERDKGSLLAENAQLRIAAGAADERVASFEYEATQARAEATAVRARLAAAEARAEAARSGEEAARGDSLAARREVASAHRARDELIAHSRRLEGQLDAVLASCADAERRAGDDAQALAAARRDGEDARRALDEAAARAAAAGGEAERLRGEADSLRRAHSARMGDVLQELGSLGEEQGRVEAIVRKLHGENAGLAGEVTRLRGRLRDLELQRDVLVEAALERGKGGAAALAAAQAAALAAVSPGRRLAGGASASASAAAPAAAEGRGAAQGEAPDRTSTPATASPGVGVVDAYGRHLSGLQARVAAAAAAGEEADDAAAAVAALSPSTVPAPAPASASGFPPAAAAAPTSGLASLTISFDGDEKGEDGERTASR
jgi:regulator of replication initiation timing